MQEFSRLSGNHTQNMKLQRAYGREECPERFQLHLHSMLPVPWNSDGNPWVYRRRHTVQEHFAKHEAQDPQKLLLHSLNFQC
jgi:hypothetical protein